MPRRRVRRSATFLDQAHQLFPPGGSAAGRPSFELFESGPLRGAETAFALNFEAQREPVEGVGAIRFVMIPPTPMFGPIVIYACLNTDDEVEIISVIEDEDYWDRLDDEPGS